MIGLGVALPAVSLCINRRLYNIATMRNASASPRERRIQTFIDFGIGLGIPGLVMILHYVVQGHRYDVVEDIGCIPTMFHTALMIPLVLMWPVVLGTISLVYCVLSILAFLKQRRTFNAVLNSNSSSLNVSRYLRLVALAGSDVLFDLPLGIFFTWNNIVGGLQPWISWSDTHYDFGNISYMPRATVATYPGAWAALTINRWALPIAAILFFLFFGLAGESLAFYQRVLGKCAKSFRFTRAKPALVVESLGTASLPSIRVQGIHVKVERTHEIDLESAINMKTSDYATLHSAPSEKTVHITLPDLEGGGSDVDSIATRHPNYFHFPSPPPSPPSHPPNN